MNINKWETDNGIVKSETRPEGEYVYPIIAMSRVSGSNYRPYVSGSKAWREAANKALANHARSNFETR
jgi:hypothetical protein